ncbi:MAG: hypothetical protein ABRQ25_05675 [Clostridiaceae bacterium]
MEDKRLKALKKMADVSVGDQGPGLEFSSELNIFMDAFFGKKRLIIIRAEGREADIIKELREYCHEKSIEFCRLYGKNLTANDIKGKPEIDYVYDYPEPFLREKPAYISDSKQMIIVENLGEETDIGVLRAFIYMGSPCSNSDDSESLPENKLPYGSAFVFIAGNDFPLGKFASISSFWNDAVSVLDLREFQAKVREHLETYKRDVLNIEEREIYFYKVLALQYEYILPKDKKKLNIIEKYREDFYSSGFPEEIKFHKHFHHLNSSQAMCINFFYPLIKEKYLELILDILGIEGRFNYDSEHICFEKESESEKNYGRKTYFEFYIKLNSGVKIFFEIKYTENEFGKAKDDDEHKTKYRDIYMPLLMNNPAINDKFKEECMFLNNYQILRHLVQMDKDSYVVLIYPEENKGIREAALSARKEIIKTDWKNRFILFTWEDIVNQLIYRLDSKELMNYYIKDFSDKYLKY